MTIFFHLVRDQLILLITEAQKKSVALSREKREILSDLKRKLNNLEGYESDEHNIAVFRELIIEAKAKEKRGEQRLDEGPISASMCKFLKCLTLIEENLRVMFLWNQKNSSDPFDVLRSYVAQYVVQKTTDNHKKNTIQVLLDNSLLSSAQKVSNAKYEMLFNMMRQLQNVDHGYNKNYNSQIAISRCYKNHYPSRVKSDYYKRKAKAYVLDWINRVRYENKKICKEYGFSLKKEFKIIFVCSVTVGRDFQPNLGRLEGYLKKAEAVISSINNDREMKEEVPEPISATQLP